MTSHVTVEAISGAAWSSYFNAPENTFFWGYSGVSASFALFFTRTSMPVFVMITILVW